MVALALELKCKIGILSPNGWWEILPTATDLADDDNFHFEEVIFLSFGKGITNSDAEPDTIHQNANHFILLKPKTGRSSELLQTLEADLVQQGYDLSHTATMSEQIALTVEGTHSSMDNVSPDEAGGRQSCNKRPASSACSDDGPQTQSSSSVSLPKRHARSDGLQGEIVCDETEPNVNGMEDSAVTDWPDEPAPGPELELPANNSGETPAATETPSAGEPPPVDLVVGTVFPYFQGDTPNTEAALQHVVDALKKGFSQWAANCGHRLHIRTAIQGRSDDKKKRKIRISCFRAGPAGPDRVSSRDDFDANLLRAKAAKTLGPCGCMWQVSFLENSDKGGYVISSLCDEHNHGGDDKPPQPPKYKTLLGSLEPQVLNTLATFVSTSTSTNAIRDLFVANAIPFDFTHEEAARLKTRLRSWLATGKLDDIRQRSRSQLLGELSADEVCLFLTGLREGRNKKSVAELLDLLKARIPGFGSVVADDGKGNLTGFVCMTARQRERARQWGQYIVIDGTYSTNREGFTMFLPVIIDPNNHVYRIAFAFCMTEHSHQAQKFVLDGLVQLCRTERDARSFLPDICQTVMSDAGFSAEVIKTAISQQVNAQICLWHIKKDIKKHIGRLSSCKELEESFNRLRNAKTIAEFDKIWAEMERDFQHSGPVGSPGSAINYLRTWVNIRERWALPWVSRHFTTGRTSSQSSEAANSQYKQRFTTVTNLQGCIINNLILERQEENRELSAGRIASQFIEAPPFFTDAFHQVGLQAQYQLREILQKITCLEAQVLPTTPNVLNCVEAYSVTSILEGTPAQSVLRGGPTGQTFSCSCNVEKVWAIPCKHILRVFLSALTHLHLTQSAMSVLFFNSIHPRWRRSTIDPAACLRITDLRAIEQSEMLEADAAFEVDAEDELEKLQSQTSVGPNQRNVRLLDNYDDEFTQMKSWDMQKRREYVINTTKQMWEWLPKNPSIFIEWARQTRAFATSHGLSTSTSITMVKEGSATVIADPSFIPKVGNPSDPKQRVVGGSSFRLPTKSVGICGFCCIPGHNISTCPHVSKLGVLVNIAVGEWNNWHLLPDLQEKVNEVYAVDSDVSALKIIGKTRPSAVSEFVYSCVGYEAKCALTSKDLVVIWQGHLSLHSLRGWALRNGKLRKNRFIIIPC